MNENEIQKTVSGLSLEEKIGALLTLGFSGTIPDPDVFEGISRYHCGGLRLIPGIRTSEKVLAGSSGGRSVGCISNGKHSYRSEIAPPQLTAAEYRDVLSHLQNAALEKSGGIPLHFSINQEGDGPEADCAFPGMTLFPRPMGLKITGDPGNAYKAAFATARQCRAIGFSTIYGPVLDINSNPRNPEISSRAYSDRAEEVAEWAVETCRGLRDGGLIATGKHFPGKGDMAVSTSVQVPRINTDRGTLLRRELLPYRELLQRNLLPSIMLAHGLYPALDEEHIATVSEQIIQGLLRDSLGFRGVVTTESMTHGYIEKRYGVPQACAMALAAGADQVRLDAKPHLIENTVREIMLWVEKGRITEADLNGKVTRVLQMKASAGLFSRKSERSSDGSYTAESPAFVFTDVEFSAFARNIAAKSLCLIREKEDLLPLAQQERILICEQLFTTANHRTLHPGMLYYACAKYNPNLMYLEVSIEADETDRERIRDLARKFDTIIFTNFHSRGNRTNRDIINSIAGDPSKEVIVVTNTPYLLSVPEKAGTIVLAGGYTPECMEATASLLFNEGMAEGALPVNNSDLPFLPGTLI